MANGSVEKKLRQIAWVFDLNKCIGCQTCSVACKVLWTREEGEKHQWWMSVNTMPGQGTPKGWQEMGGGIDRETGKPRPGHQPTREEFGGGFEFNYDEVFYGGTAGKAHLEPQGSRENRWSMNWDEDQGAGEWPNSYYFYLPRMCNHCSNAVCVSSCPTGALQKRPDDGLVIRDEDICMGDRFCMEACPYKKISFNYERHVAQQCIGCFPRIEAGVAPACVRQCPGRAVFVGYLDDEDGPVHRLVREWGIALPLLAEAGTGPNVYYVPPLAPHRLNDDLSIDTETPRIPPEYLESLFGTRVHTALATLQGEMDRVREGGSSEMLKTLIAYKWKELLGPFTVDPAELTPSGNGSGA
jgi:ethylbenzene hydroxylase subunit beta/complex iron-sulfur molybdoenzyme family reductase subunit beta